MAQVISRKSRGGMGKFESVSTRRPIFFAIFRVFTGFVSTG